MGLTYVEGVVQNLSVFRSVAMLISVRNELGGHSWGVAHQLLPVMLYLTEAAPTTGSPIPTFEGPPPSPVNIALNCVFLFSAACYRGWYGQDCSERCGQCQDNAACDVVSGACVSCGQAGRQLPLCKTGKPASLLVFEISYPF